MKFMFDDPLDLINNYIQSRLNNGVDMGVNEECLIHLNKIREIYPNDESLE